MKKIEKLKEQLAKNLIEIKQLETFRKVKLVNELVRNLFAEQSNLKHEIKKILATKEQKEKIKQVRNKIANKNRSEKMKRGFRYFRAIQENFFPEKSTKEIRSAFSKHRRGLESNISDIIWRNPSP